jgi:prolipoprotein diacylglyceryltransferase
VALVAAAASAVVGGGSAGTLALIAAVTTQAFTRLGNAADQGLVGNPSVGNAAKAIRTALPRYIDSPMIADLQTRGQGGPVAPRFEVNGAIATAHASSWGDVLWTLLWCLALAALAANAMRRRSL